jgi:hypothetical protein
MPDLHIAPDGEEIDVQAPEVGVVYKEKEPAEVKAEKVWYEEGACQGKKDNGVWMYLVGGEDMFIDKGFMQEDGGKMDVTEVMA